MPLNLSELSAGVPAVTLKLRGKGVLARAISEMDESIIRSAFERPKGDIILNPFGNGKETIVDTQGAEYQKRMRAYNSNVEAAFAGAMLDVTVDGAGNLSDALEEKARKTWFIAAAKVVRSMLSTEEIRGVINAVGRASDPQVVENEAKKDSSSTQESAA